MFAITGKDGKISVVRVGTLTAILGVLIILGAVVTFLIDQQARRRPLTVDPPDAAVWRGEREIGLTEQWVQYSVAEGDMSMDDVVAYYNDRLKRFDDSQECKRSPRGDANYSDYIEGTGRVPFQWQCMFENSGFNTTQFTLVRIQPGVYREDSAVNTEGMIVIQYEQQWSP